MSQNPPPWPHDLHDASGEVWRCQWKGSAAVRKWKVVDTNNGPKDLDISCAPGIFWRKTDHTSQGLFGIFSSFQEMILNPSSTDWSHRVSVVSVLLVGGFNPFEQYLSNWNISPGRGENKEYLKPPPSLGLENRRKVGCDIFGMPSF